MSDDKLVEKWTREAASLRSDGGPNTEAWTLERCAEELRAALSAAPQATVPDGWVLVPKEHTQQMLDAANAAVYRARQYGNNESAAVYRAMLSASPHPAKAGVDEIERLRTMILDACQVFDHYDLPEHALHYRRALGSTDTTHSKKGAGHAE